MIGEWLFAVSHSCDMKIHREEELLLAAWQELTTNRWSWKLVGGAERGRAPKRVVQRWLKIIYDGAYISADTQGSLVVDYSLSLYTKCFSFFLLLMAGWELYFPSKWLACDYMLESIWGRGSFPYPQCLLILGLRYPLPISLLLLSFIHFLSFFPLYPSRLLLSLFFFLAPLLLYPSYICSLLLIFFHSTAETWR